MHITNGIPEPTIKTRWKYSESQKLVLEWFDSDEKRAGYWVRISAICISLNELTAYKSALYKKKLKP